MKIQNSIFLRIISKTIKIHLYCIVDVFRKVFEKLLKIYLKRFFVHVTCREKKLSHHSFNATLHFNNLRTALYSKRIRCKNTHVLSC